MQHDFKIFDPEAEMLLATRPLTPCTEQLYLEEKGGQRSPLLTLRIDNVKVFCPDCDRREALSPIHYYDVANALLKQSSRDRSLSAPPFGFQLFVLTYLCQGCKGSSPQSFIVRRKNWDFILEGRSPMEYVEVPSFIPKPERNLFRDAIIASHGGKPLAALFYLRAFIEQFARRLTGLTGKVTGEQIMEAYSNTLPPQHRDYMPSLRHWYDKLSEPVHEARDDAELFERARAQIERHFDIRRVFKIPDEAPPKGV